MEIPTPLILLPVLLAGVAFYALISVYAERKISAFIQDRMGPMEVGPYGLLQTFADIIKLLLKERITPAAADKALFLIAPALVYASVFAGFAALPFGTSGMAIVANVGVVYILAVVSMEVVGILMAGWGSNNKYSLLGAVRAVSQIISYEVPAALAILATLAIYGTLRLDEITLLQSPSAQEPLYFLGLWDIRWIGGFVNWGIVRYPHLVIVFIIYFIATLAESNRAPFDIPEAESEIIAGYLTEYGGFGFAALMLAEYANMLLVSLIGATLFFGGWTSPLPNLMPYTATEHTTIWELCTHLQFATLTNGTAGAWSAGAWAVFWLLTKAVILVLIQMWIRWTFPRLRADQLMTLCWKYLTPFALAGLILSVCWKVAELYIHAP